MEHTILEDFQVAYRLIVSSTVENPSLTRLLPKRVEIFYRQLHDCLIPEQILAFEAFVLREIEQSSLRLAKAQNRFAQTKAKPMLAGLVIEWSMNTHVN